MDNLIITIARQYGSGGRAIGEVLARKLGIAFYDKELISLTAKKTGFALDFVREVEERQTSSFLYSVYTATQVPTVYDQARTAQFEVIREITEEGPCVIVGRAADCILRDSAKCVRVFIHAPMEERIQRATQEYGESPENIQRELEKKDRSRAAFYNNYSDSPWGDTRNYDLTISSTIGIEATAEIIIAYIRAKFPGEIQ